MSKGTFGEVFKGNSVTLSSKRVFGFGCLLVGIICAIVILYVAITKKPADWSGNTAEVVLFTIFGSATSLLGLGIFEKNVISKK